MNLLRLVLFGDRNTRLWLWLALLVSAIMPVAAIAIVNVVIGTIIEGNFSAQLALVFVPVVVFLIIANVVSVRLTGAALERALHDRITSIQKSISELEYHDFCNLGGSTINDTLNRSMSILMGKGFNIVVNLSMLGSSILLSIYTLYLSVFVFFIYLTIFALGLILIMASRRLLEASYRQAGAAESTFFLHFRQLIGGFKEVRLNSDRADDITTNYLLPATDNVRQKRLNINILASRSGAAVQAVTWGSVGIAAFVLPLYIREVTLIIQAIYVGIYFRGNLVSLIYSLPPMTMAEGALKDLDRLTEKLGDMARVRGGAVIAPSFETLSLDAVTFDYSAPDGATSFVVGPLDLTLRRGEVVFLIGPNGGGKSTILRLICSLDRPVSGVMRINDNIVDDNNRDTYRALFSAVFSDFFVFDRLYGLATVDDNRANHVLEQFGLDQKLQVKDGDFSSIDLSSGQRQRLALATALLEDRPILLLDEVAADQDPEFRERFYRDFVPKWKEEGRTLVVVSHDSRYFDVADRVLSVSDGRISSEADPQAQR